MRRYLSILAAIAWFFVPLAAHAAADQWSYEADSLSAKIPTQAGPRDIYYHFDDTTDSSWVYLPPNSKYVISLDGDTTATTAGATVQIRYSISAPTANGSAVLLGATLTGTWPGDQIEDVPGGMFIQVDVQANAGSDSAVVRVRRQ